MSHPSGYLERMFDSEKPHPRGGLHKGGKESRTQDAAEKLASVRWDFAGSSSRSGIHSIHPYPAKFIPEIPRELIRLFHPGDLSPVLDPFCGSGTTLVEAAAAGLPAVGIDLHPLAILIGRVKTTPLDSLISPVASTVVANARREPAPIPDIPRLDHWFLPEIQDVLARLTSQINLVDSNTVRDALKVALSRIIVRVSNQESDTRYAAISKDVSADRTCELFLASVHGLEKALSQVYGGMFTSQPSVTLMNRDVLKVEPSEIAEPAGLVITSPPYPNAYEYWLYHKYRMYWLGMDPLQVKAAEIGARPHYFKKNHQTEADFEKQMSRCFWLLARVVQEGGIVCFLVGRSVIHGRVIDNRRLLERAADPHGFRLLAVVDRAIAPSRKSFNPAHGTINGETIVLFSLEGPRP